jgi:hypothetical protein
MIGATGTGKSTLIGNMIRQDMKNGKGVILFDPHGDLWAEALRFVPKDREKDLVLAHLGDPSYPFTMNILAGQGGHPAIERHTITNGLIDLFKRTLYQNVPEAFGPMFENYFRNSLMLLMEAMGDEATILDFERIFSDQPLPVEEESGKGDDDSQKEDAIFNPFATERGNHRTFRQMLLKRCKNERIRAFWEMVEKTHGETSLENFAPYITSKLTQISGSPLLAPILGARESSLDFGEIIREGKICLINLAKGRIGGKDAAFAGSVMSLRMTMAALAQARIPESERRPTSIYLDEFQTYASDYLADAMAEVRKYKVSLILAHQTLSQINGKHDTSSILGEILGNAANLIAFRIGILDAEIIARWFAPHFTAEQLARLPDYTAAARLLCDGTPLPPLTFRTLPPH